MQLDALYQEIILDHYKHPHGRGLRDPEDPTSDAPPQVAEAHHVNPTCGDEVTVRVHLSGDGEQARVEDVSYEGIGCSISQASASVLHELVSGHRVDEAFGTHEAFLELVQGRGAVEPDEDLLGDAIAFAGVARYPARVKCALLSWMAFRDATARALAASGKESR
jgi:nitrogen fixation protein NifU and related proteins